MRRVNESTLARMASLILQDGKSNDSALFSPVRKLRWTTKHIISSHPIESSAPSYYKWIYHWKSSFSTVLVPYLSFL